MNFLEIFDKVETYKVLRNQRAFKVLFILAKMQVDTWK